MRTRRRLWLLLGTLLLLTLFGCALPKESGGAEPQQKESQTHSPTETLLLRQVQLYLCGSGGAEFDESTPADERSWGFAGLFAEKAGVPYGREGGRQELLRLMWREWIGGGSEWPDYYFSDASPADHAAVAAIKSAKFSSDGETAELIVSRVVDGIELLDQRYVFSRVKAGGEVLAGAAVSLTQDGYLWQYTRVETLPDETVYEPVTITTEEELRDLCRRVNAHEPSAVNGHFILGNDIVLSQDVLWTPMGVRLSENEDWESLFASARARGGFCGVFDGAGHTISGVRVKGTSPMAEEGFFSRIGPGARVTDLTIRGTIEGYGVQETLNACTGGFAGRICAGAVVTGCRFEGSVSGYSYTGGFAGVIRPAFDREEEGGEVANCTSDASVSASYAGGGFAGAIAADLSSCDAKGLLTIRAYPNGCNPVLIGGFAGCVEGEDTLVSGCRSAVRVEYDREGANYMGSFLGEFAARRLTDCVIEPAAVHDGWYLVGRKIYADSSADIRKEVWTKEADAV